jgi:hypothetical protein
MFASLVITLAIVSAVPPPAPAPALQKNPDFTGTWVEDEKQRKITPPLQEAPKNMAVITGPPPQKIITQTAQMIRIDNPWQHGVVTYIYKLDGSESVNLNGANTQTTRSRWEGGKLITEGTSFSETSAGESTWKFKEVRWMNASGAMVSETSNIDEAGKLHHVVRVFTRKK